MLNSPLIADLIFKGEVHEIKEIMKKSRELGMQTFDQALFDLYEAGQDQLRRRAAQRRLRQRPAPHDQAALQGIEEPRHHAGHRAPEHRLTFPDRRHRWRSQDQDAQVEVDPWGAIHPAGFPFSLRSHFAGRVAPCGAFSWDPRCRKSEFFVKKCKGDG